MYSSDLVKRELDLVKWANFPKAAMFRGDVQRTGVYDTRAVHEFHDVKWKVKVSKLSRTIAISTPAVAWGIVCFGEMLALCAVDAETGKERWRCPEKTGFVLSSPAIINDTVYFTHHGLCAVDIETGDEKWRIETRDSPPPASPAVDNGVVYFGGRGGYLHAVDAETGKERWKFGTEAEISSSPAVANGLVYFRSSHEWNYSNHNGDGHWYAVDIETGREKWRLEKKDRDGFPCHSPAYAYEKVYFHRSLHHFCAVDALTGKEKWKLELKQGVGSSPAVADGAVYFGGNDGYLYAVDAETGKERWRRFRTERNCFWPTSIADGVAYLGGNGLLYALDTRTGKEKWRIELEEKGDSVSASPAIADGVVFFRTDHGYLYAIR